MKTDVREMSQEDYDKVPDQQRAFYQGLLDSGQLVIKKAERKQRGPYQVLFDIPVTITFLDGSTLSVILTDAWTYEFGLIKDGRYILVLKHSVSRIEQSE